MTTEAITAKIQKLLALADDAQRVRLSQIEIEGQQGGQGDLAPAPGAAAAGYRRHALARWTGLSGHGAPPRCG